MTTRDGNGQVGRTPRDIAVAAITRSEADGALAELPAGLQRICRAAAASPELYGASLHVLTGPATGSVVAASDHPSREVGEAVFASGEGPALDAFDLSRPVLVPDLLAEGQARWPGFVSAVRRAGARSCFSLPLHVGVIRLGVLDLYGRAPGSLEPTRMSLALTFAELATERLLQKSVDVPPHALDGRLLDLMERRSEIHQAQGMVMVDLAVDLAEALALLRASSFRRDLALLEVAREIVAGGRLP